VQYGGWRDQYPVCCFSTYFHRASSCRCHRTSVWICLFTIRPKWNKLLMYSSFSTAKCTQTGYSHWSQLVWHSLEAILLYFHTVKTCFISRSYPQTNVLSPVITSESNVRFLDVLLHIDWNLHPFFIRLMRHNFGDSLLYVQILSQNISALYKWDFHLISQLVDGNTCFHEQVPYFISYFHSFLLWTDVLNIYHLQQKSFHFWTLKTTQMLEFCSLFPLPKQVLTYYRFI
jgi:hypothetical protein